MAVITISRQLGSGGDAIATLVAEQLKYRYFDKQLLIEAAAEAGLTQKHVVDFSEDNYEVGLSIEVANLERRSLRPRFEVVLGTLVRRSADFQDAQLRVLQAESLEDEYLSGFGLPGFLGFGSAERERSFLSDIDWAAVNSRYFIVALALRSRAPRRRSSARRSPASEPRSRWGTRERLRSPRGFR